MKEKHEAEVNLTFLDLEIYRLIEALLLLPDNVFRHLTKLLVKQTTIRLMSYHCF
jgi:hypothetical protein